jgi:1-acylglycerone phosphate reductase
VVPVPFGAVYAASKAALHQYSYSVRLELAPFDVDILTIVAGGVCTNIADSRAFPEDSIFVAANEGLKMRTQLGMSRKP